MESLMGAITNKYLEPAKPRFLIDDLMLLRAFVAVVETQSFTRAGARLGIVPSSISKHIKALEQRLEGRLVMRSTKHLSITEIGTRFYERCLHILETIEQAESEISEYNAEPQGLLHVSCATTLALRHFGPIFMSFLKKYPKVQIDVSLSVSNDDLVATGMDVAIRISSRLDPNLIALKLASNTRVCCASPAYLETYGAPTSPKDLLHHNCLILRGMQHTAHWSFLIPGKEPAEILVAGNFSADNSELLRQAVLADLGVGYLARYLVEQHLAAGELVELFPEARSADSTIYAVYPARWNLPLKTRAFLDHLRAEFRIPPEWAS
jgi:DNA-binding transcriptional LysR family regulator